jgi:ABC-2 type transport system ATP-binding protein
VLGAPVGDVAVRRGIGFLPEDFRFYDWLTATELLQLHGRLCGMPPMKLRARVPEMLNLVGLEPHADRRLRGFSKGMLQRIGLAQALIHEPDLVFLDEPTSGLDPIGRRLVRDILRAERNRGATVFLNSHLLSEIEVTCDQVVFIKNGEVVANRDLRAGVGDDVRVAAQVRNVSAAAISGLAPWSTESRLEGERLTLDVRSRTMLPNVMRHLVTSGADVFAFTPERVPLEELFVSIMGEDPGL